MAFSKTLLLLAFFATALLLSTAFDPKDNTHAEEESKYGRGGGHGGGHGGVYGGGRGGRFPPAEGSEVNSELYGQGGGYGGYGGYGHGGGGYGHGGGGYGHGGGGYGHGGHGGGWPPATEEKKDGKGN